MTGPVPNNQDEPLAPEAFAHQVRLLKSAHCCRPVLYQGKQQFINGLTLHHDAGRVGMIVWLKGSNEAIDSSEVEIKPSSPSEEKDHA